MNETEKNQRHVFLSLLSAPTFWLIVFFILPMGLVWLYSFGEKQGLIEIAINWNLDNYKRVFEPIFIQVFIFSFFIAGLVTFICLVLGLPLALMIVYAPAKWKPILLLLIILPFWTNLLIRTYALIAVLRTRGYVNFTLDWFHEKALVLFEFVGLAGLGLSLLGERFTPLPMLYNDAAVVIGLVYVHLPFMVLPLYAALERLDRSLIEASLDLGAGHIRTLLFVVTPLALPGIISGIVITFIPTLGSYLTPDLLGGTDSLMIANVIERQFKAANDWPFGAALSFLLMYITFGALALRAYLARGKEGGGLS